MPLPTRLPLPAVAFAVLAAGVSGAETARAVDGKEILLAQKCDRCHAVPSAGIKPAGLIKGAPELSGKVLKIDASTLGRYLRKEMPRNNRKHPVAFAGTEADLTGLIAWIRKQAPKDK